MESYRLFRKATVHLDPNRNAGVRVCNACRAEKSNGEEISSAGYDASAVVNCQLRQEARRKMEDPITLSLQ